MAKEIERKFLVKDTAFLTGLVGRVIVQGYLADAPMTTRVRVIDDKAFLTLKGPTVGISRDEFEYEIPFEDAQTLIAIYCGDRIVSKIRYEIAVDGHTFEVDVFTGRLTGLVLAEVEVGSESEAYALTLPDWVGQDVSTDWAYANSSLSRAASSVSA